MEAVSISDLVKRSFEVLIIITFPFLIVSLAIGLIVSFLQTLTNIQEATLTFAPKIISIIILAVLMGGFFFSEIRDFISELFLSIPKIVK